MLKYSVISREGKVARYYYYPEGRLDAPGVLEIVGNTKSGKVIEESKADFNKRYAFQGIRGIDVSKDKGTVAWY